MTKSNNLKIEIFMRRFADLANECGLDGIELRDFLCSACIGYMARLLPSKERVQFCAQDIEKAILELQRVLKEQYGSKQVALDEPGLSRP